jgi:hypothetical protein
MSHNIKTPLTSISRAVGNILQLKDGQLIKSLFANNEQGFFYDPNDLSTMFQDSAGTIPVTAVGQPVGLMLDKSKGLAREATNFWTGSVTKIDANWANNGDGTFISNGGSGIIGLTSTSMKTGRFYEWTFEVTSRTSGAVRPQNGTGLNYQYASSVGTHIQKALCSDNSLYFYSNAFNGTIRPISVRELAGNHAYQTTSASRPILRKNAVTGANYLEFDGSDDFLQTSNIDFTGTDKVSLFSGVRKFGTTRGTIAEFGASGFGRFILNSNRLDATSFSYLGENASPFPSVQSMDSAVLSAQTNLSAKTHSLKANNVKTSSLWSGNLSTTYQNAAVYIGRQAGGAYSFNGHIYCLIGVGKLTSDTETVDIERELAKRVGVTLNV